MCLHSVAAAQPWQPPANNRLTADWSHLRPNTGILPGLPSVMVKRMRVAFDGGRMTSEAGISLFAAIEQRLGGGALADLLRPLPRRVRASAARACRDGPLWGRC